MALLDVREVEKTYSLGKTKIHAVQGISFTVEKGDFLCVVGPSGCGKTTLLNIVGCIDHPDSGVVLMNETNLADMGDDEAADLRLSTMGFIFQAFNLVPVLNVIENVEFPLILAGRQTEERRERARDLIDAVGLSEYETHKPDELSGGQRQRVAIARALVNRPEIVIADEPTANLDSETGDMVLEVMKRLNRERSVSFLFSTHNQSVMSYAHQVMYLKDGRIERTETRDNGT